MAELDRVGADESVLALGEESAAGLDAELVLVHPAGDLGLVDLGGTGQVGDGDALDLEAGDGEVVEVGELAEGDGDGLGAVLAADGLVDGDQVDEGLGGGGRRGGGGGREDGNSGSEDGGLHDDGCFCFEEKSWLFVMVVVVVCGDCMLFCL